MISILIPNKNESSLEKVKEAIPYLPFDCQVVITTNDGEGKGVALREALKEAIGDTIVFLDADMDIEPRMVERLIPFLLDYDIVVATKNLKNVTWKRKVLTTLSRIYIGVLFGLRVDTQTGLKVFKRKFLTSWKTDGYACDIEILSLAKKMGAKMIEVPVEAKITRNMPLRAIWKTLKDSLRIKFQLLFPAEK